MIITYFRSSSYNTFNLCEQQYFLNYVLGLYQPSGKRAEIGTIVHKILECLAQAKLAHQNGLSYIEDEHFGTIHFDDLFDQSLVDTLVNLSYEYYTDQAKTVNAFKPADRRECKQLVMSVLDGEMFDPRRREIVAAEPHFDFELEEDWARYDYGNGITGRLRLKGTIDLIARINDEMYENIDWKTGQRKDWNTDQPKDFYKLCVDPQLRIYHLALNHMYPDIKYFAITIHWIRDGGPFTLSYGPDDLVETKNMLKQQFKKIQLTTRPKLKSNTGQHWFCKRVCYYGKNCHKDNPNITTCQFIKQQTIKHGMDYVINNYRDTNFNVNHYQNPGA